MGGSVMRRCVGAATALTIGGVVALSGCGSSGGGTAAGTPTAGTSVSGAAAGSGGLAAAQAALAKSYAGTWTAPDPTSRPAVPGRKVAIITLSMAVISSQVPATAAAQAAKAIGWTSEIYDAQLNPGNIAGLVRRAISTGANGILLVGVDCQAARQPLEEARAKGIAVVPVLAFDCTDPLAGASSTGVFSADAAFPNGQTTAEFTESFGADNANYVIAKSDDKAKIILITEPEVSVIKHVSKGFADTIARSGGAQIVDTLPITQNDILTGKLVAKIQAEILRHPEANWIKSPFTYATTLGIIPALGANPRKIKVMGSEGFKDELDLIRQGKVTAVDAIPTQWTAWAAVDNLNSVFRKEKPVPSGLGWRMTDADHNLPASGDPQVPVDYTAAFRKAWGVG